MIEYFVFDLWRGLPDNIFNSNITECHKRELNMVDFSVFMLCTLEVGLILLFLLFIGILYAYVCVRVFTFRFR